MRAKKIPNHAKRCKATGRSDLGLPWHFLEGIKPLDYGLSRDCILYFCQPIFEWYMFRPNTFDETFTKPNFSIGKKRCLESTQGKQTTHWLWVLTVGLVFVSVRRWQYNRFLSTRLFGSPRSFLSLAQHTFQGRYLLGLELFQAGPIKRHPMARYIAYLDIEGHCSLCPQVNIVVPQSLSFLL